MTDVSDKDKETTKALGAGNGQSRAQAYLDKWECHLTLTATRGQRDGTTKSSG